MANAVEVADSISNAEENIERAAKVIGRSDVRRRVFSAIYYHKKKVKTISEIVKRTKLPRIRVLQEARHIFRNGLARQQKDAIEPAYEKIDFFDVHKIKILRLAADRKKLAALPTKRKIAVKLPKSITIPSNGARVHRITIDDVETFAAAKKKRFSGTLPKTISEKEFKAGIQKIIGEPGEFKDWGGETSDLYSTRLKIKGKRMAAAFGFKGPGQPGVLVPGRMGKNGDQIQRLFQEDADVFFVQHWREIKTSVIDQMRSMAIAKSVTTGKPIWYGIIDGQDSERLRIAYLSKFQSSKKKKR